MAKKQAKSVEKNQERVDKIAARLAEVKSKRNAVEEGLNSTKTLDELKEQKRERLRKNEEDQAIIKDENASDSEKEAARDRVAARNAERDRLQPQIEARERILSVRERVKKYLKENGVTLATIFFFFFIYTYILL